MPWVNYNNHIFCVLFVKQFTKKQGYFSLFLLLYNKTMIHFPKGGVIFCGKTPGCCVQKF